MEFSCDRNLFLGVIALQAELINADQLAAACSHRSGHQANSLLEFMCEKGWLLPEDLTHLEYLAERRLTKCGHDVRESLAACQAEVRSVLASISSDTLGVSHNTIAFEGGDSGEIPEAKPGHRYNLSALHAAGGIGEIWLARDAHLQRDVAVKRLQAKKSPSAVVKMRFLREARITGQLNHPGVVPIYEICLDEEGQPYYAMRFLQGGTLTDAVKKYHRQRKASGSDHQAFLTLLSAFCIVCNTVAYAHSKGIIHRDLKCDNVILGDYGEVVVIDWGLAKEVGSNDPQASEDTARAELATGNPLATLAGHIMGTPAYMAPEQATGRLDLIGPTTDVYGLCAILYEILCGQAPFLGNNAKEVLQKVEQEGPIRPSMIVPGIPEKLEHICLKGLAKSPGDRQPSAEALATAVQSWVSELAERRQAEEERERFFALSLDLLAIVDESGRLGQVSPAWERLLGYEPAQLAGRSFFEFLHAEDRSATMLCLNAVTEGQNARVFEARVLPRFGSYRWVSWNATPITKEQSVYVVGRDITDLKKSQQLFEGILQSAPDAMVLIDPQGRIVMVNRQMEHVFGYAQAEMLGQPVEILIPERYREKHPAKVASFFGSSSVRPMGAGLPLRGRRKDGQEFLVDIALSPIRTESGKLVAASVRDLSARGGM